MIDVAVPLSAPPLPLYPDMMSMRVRRCGALGAAATAAAVAATQRARRTRAARTAHIRSYQFQSSLPLLTSVLNRFPDGVVKSHWVMVERVTQTVTCMDPYPWDDLDEEYTLPLAEFMVRWELAGCESIVFRT